MANALAKTDMVDVNMQDLTLTLFVAYSGPEVNDGFGALAYVQVALLAGDSATVIRQKMSTAVAAYASSQGWTVAGTAMTLPTFQKG